MFGGMGFIFSEFYKEAKSSTQLLLRETISANILNLKHFLGKNLTRENIHQIVAYLDNSVNANKFIKDIHIINDKQEVLYSTDRGDQLFHINATCIPIAKIHSSNVFKERCYFIPIKLFKGFKPYYYKAYIYIDKTYINSLMQKLAYKYIAIFSIYGFIVLLILWISLQNLLIIPLEQLRQFAYYQNTKSPNQEFFIQELESIRYSLNFTFQRLKKEQDELFKLSTKDSLSGLYNRLSLMEKINWLIAKCERSNEEFALLFLDLDNFKTINDTQGHEFGDKVLQHVSKILLDSVRENDIVSRIGGDEFVIILPEIQNKNTVIEVVTRIQKRLNEPIIYKSFSYTVTASIGITIYPKDGHDVSTLLKHADIAMYKSKDLGKNNFYFFTESLNEAIHQRLHMQNKIKTALTNNYFELYFQPKVAIATGKVVACEALIRLNDPKDGLIPPNDFISIAEESNLIIPLGEWIIKEASKVLQEWNQSELKNIKLSINVSAMQFQSKNFMKILEEATRDIDRNLFDIELTESLLMNDFDEKLEVIHAIKKLGISLSLDDFGTGYSSLSYLKTIPFDTLKIDKSFIDDFNIEQNRSFINMIVGIADDLHLDVVAEGVEQKEQLDYLASINCEQYQGYYCSKPLPQKDFEKLFITSQCF
jgi:diguanylate cyclase (GGDEF)-like protein